MQRTTKSQGGCSTDRRLSGGGRGGSEKHNDNESFVKTKSNEKHQYDQDNQ